MQLFPAIVVSYPTSLRATASSTFRGALTAHRYLQVLVDHGVTDVTVDIAMVPATDFRRWDGKSL